MGKEKNSQIVFMLDLQKTLDGITDETAQIFMKQVEKLRNKFEASRAILFISSQTEYREDLYLPAGVLKRNLEPNI